MMTAHATSGRRMALSYSVEGLPLRDELLFKSLIRVLDHRTHQQWECVESGANLRVSGAPFGASTADGQPGAVLRMGYPPANGETGLPMPLHAGHLELAFNRLGAQLEQQRAEVAAVAALQPLREDEAFRLRRWPPASLVTTPERRSLAALMSVRAQSLANLQRLSDVALPLCTEFLRDLRQADLVISTPVLSAVAAAREAVVSAAPASPMTPRAPQVDDNPSGLFARIRARFGLQPAWSR